MEDFFSIKELNNILERNDIKYEGNRNELLNKIESELSPRDIFGKKYVLTEKGKRFLKQHSAYEYFIDNCIKFNFYEFSEFVSHYDGKFKNIIESFINHMEDISINYEDYDKYHTVIEQRLENIEDRKSIEFLIIFTQLFIIDINYWLNNKEHENGDKPLSDEIILNYPEIKQLFVDKDICRIFNEAILLIKFESLREQEDIALFYFLKSFEYDDIDDINREVEYETFKEDYINSLVSIN